MKKLFWGLALMTIATASNADWRFIVQSTQNELLYAKRFISQADCHEYGNDFVQFLHRIDANGGLVEDYTVKLRCEYITADAAGE